MAGRPRNQPKGTTPDSEIKPSESGLIPQLPTPESEGNVENEGNETPEPPTSEQENTGGEVSENESENKKNETPETGKKSKKEQLEPTPEQKKIIVLALSRFRTRDHTKIHEIDDDISYLSEEEKDSLILRGMAVKKEI